jgi:CBS domain-containing protein
MKVAEVMSRGVDPVPPSSTIREAAIQMAEMDVGAVLVGSPDALEGILTDRDIILRVVVEGKSSDTPVSEVMSSSLFTCRGDDGVDDAFRQMQERQVRRLPVCDDEGKLVGIVTLADIARRRGDSEQLQLALRDLVEPHRRSDKPDDPDTAGKNQARLAS